MEKKSNWLTFLSYSLPANTSSVALQRQRAVAIHSAGRFGKKVFTEKFSTKNFAAERSCTLLSERQGV